MDDFDIQRFSALVGDAIQIGLSNSVQSFATPKERRVELLSQLTVKIAAAGTSKYGDAFKQAKGIVELIENDLKNWPHDEHVLELFSNGKYFKGVCTCTEWSSSSRERNLIDAGFKDHLDLVLRPISLSESTDTAGDSIKPNDALK